MEVKSFKRRVFEFLWQHLNLSSASQSRLSEFLVPIVKNQTKYGEIKFFCPGGRTVGRADTMFTKETNTIAWIDSLDDGIFWDIGANVGIYTLYAASKGHSVFAFEPSPLNYAVLAKNIQINEVQAQALCIAFSNSNSIESFDMGALEYGYARAGLNTGKDISVAALAFTIDDFVKTYKLVLPKFIKIDIDGGEFDLLTGAKETFSSVEVSEIQIEVGVSRWRECQEIMASLGFSLANDGGVGSLVTNNPDQDVNLLFKKKFVEADTNQSPQ